MPTAETLKKLLADIAEGDPEAIVQSASEAKKLICDCCGKLAETKRTGVGEYYCPDCAKVYNKLECCSKCGGINFYCDANTRLNYEINSGGDLQYSDCVDDEVKTVNCADCGGEYKLDEFNYIG